MPDLAHIKRQTAKGFDAAGERVDILRAGGSSFDPVATGVRAVIRGYSADELLEPIQQGDIRVMLLAQDLPAGVVPQRNDRVVIGAAHYALQDVDPFSRRIAGETIVFDCQARG